MSPLQPHQMRRLRGRSSGPATPDRILCQIAPTNPHPSTNKRLLRTDVKSDVGALLTLIEELTGGQWGMTLTDLQVALEQEVGR